MSTKRELKTVEITFNENELITLIQVFNSGSQDYFLNSRQDIKDVKNILKLALEEIL